MPAPPRLHAVPDASSLSRFRRRPRRDATVTAARAGTAPHGPRRRALAGRRAFHSLPESTISSEARRCVDRDHRGSAGVDGVDDLGAVDALEVDRSDPEVRVPELALDDDQRDAFASHLHGVRVAELVGCEAPAHTSPRGGVAQLRTRGPRGPGASAGRAGGDTQQRTAGRSTRVANHGCSCSQAQSSMPTSRRRPPLPWRTSSEPRRGSRSASPSASASWIRSPARRNTTMSARSRAACGPVPAWRMTAMITVGGRPGSAVPCCVASGPRGSRAAWPATAGDRRHRGALGA
jgi:hypothetical protein